MFLAIPVGFLAAAAVAVGPAPVEPAVPEAALAAATTQAVERAAQPDAAASAGFERYEIILTRQPFGEPISPEEAAAQLAGAQGAAQPGQPVFTDGLKLCFIGEGPMGRRVGFLDTKSKATYYLYVGQASDDGITVVDADYEGEKILLRKGTEEHWINMSGTVVAAGAPAAGGVQTTASPAQDAARTAVQATSYAERLRLRRESLRERVVQPPKLAGEDLEKHLQQYQMDLIRKGMPPLPIPLSKDMDDQLVREGVLPAAEEAGPPAPGQ